jgi:predicted secreted hydrolase
MLRRQLLQHFGTLTLAGLGTQVASANPVTNVLANAPATPNAAIKLPQDFGAHPGLQTEWWYLTGWLEDKPRGHSAPDPAFGFQLTFFRSAIRHDRNNPSRFAPQQIILAHAALTDVRSQRYHVAQKRARAGFDLAFAKVGNTDLKLDNWVLQRASDGSYTATVMCDAFELKLKLQVSQAILLQGEQAEPGISRKGPGSTQFSHYYSEPQLTATAQLQLGTAQTTRQKPTQNLSGKAWLDHEWANQVVPGEASGWDWLGINFNDGSALMAFQMRAKNGTAMWAQALLRHPDGQIQRYGPDQVQFRPIQTWQSPRTGTRYPVAQELRLTLAGQTSIWQTEPLGKDQELDARASTGNIYWEGLVRFSQNTRVIGLGYLEMTGYDKPLKL